MNCENNCEHKSVPFFVHEASLMRIERQLKTMWIALIITIISLVITNIAWLCYFSSYDYEVYEISTEGGGNASYNYIGQDGEIYGESKSTQED